MEIYDAKGKLVNSFSSKKDATYKRYDGGPPPAPKLDKKEGLNRFVWNMGHAIMPGVKDTYIEANYRGHRAIPGTYTIKLKVEDAVQETKVEIKEVPTYDIKPSQYEAFDVFMTETEANLTEMHTMVNTLFNAKNQLKKVLKKVKDESLKKEGKALLEELDAWDKDMVQRKSKAYDDVENFPNKFTAEYLFLINATNSSVPRVNQSSIDRRKELDTQWTGLRQRGKNVENVKIPAFNKKLWEAGIGAIQL